MLRMESPSFLSCRPCLRFIRGEGNFQDAFAREYLVSSGGMAEHFTSIPIGRSLADAAVAAEMHLFFQGSAFSARFFELSLAVLG